jgi:FSR family fosmidomycin resistance protein-like MFS transporter
MVDVVHTSQAEAGIAVAIWTGVGLLGDLLLLPLLERVRGISYLRVSAVLELILFAAFLLAQNIGFKLVILGLLGFFNAGWHAILKGQLYTAMPGQSGTVMTLNNISGLLGSLIPLSIGLAAQWFGLGAAMWLLLLGPLALMVGIPRNQPQAENH